MSTRNKGWENLQSTLSHGHSQRDGWSPTYYSWAAMVQRCTNPKRNNFHLYGARGITVCDRWMRFEDFLADMGERPAGSSIDRIDTNGNYEPGNCRWADRRTQNRNRTNNRLSAATAREIRSTYAAGGVSQSTLGVRFGVSKTMIRNVVLGRAWA